MRDCLYRELIYVIYIFFFTIIQSLHLGGEVIPCRCWCSGQVRGGIWRAFGEADGEKHEVLELLHSSQ